MKVIKLINSRQGWLARFVDNKEIKDLFGTDTIPTAFTEQASPMVVLQAIQAKNQGYKVEFAL